MAKSEPKDDDWRDQLVGELLQAVESTFDEMVKSGKGGEDAADTIAGLLDIALPFREALPGPLGAVLETLSDAAIEASFDALKEVFADRVRRKEMTKRHEERMSMRADIRNMVIKASTRPREN